MEANIFRIASVDLKTFYVSIYMIRILSVFIANSEFVPDESWQSIEITRWMVYGEKHSYLTWEWIHGIRSILYPMLFVPITIILRVFGIDTPFLLISLPRLFHALLTATGEYCLLRYTYRKFGEESTKWIATILIFNWFMFYCGSRTLTNNTEMALGLIGLEFLHLNKMSYFTACVGINFFLRPTSIIYWIPLIRTVFTKIVKTRKIFIDTLLVGLCVFIFNVTLDRYFYKKIIHTWWKFFQFNVLEGKSSAFGTQPFHYYITNTLPSLLGVNIGWIFLAFIRWETRYSELIPIIGNYIFIFSCIGHKEIRFLMPILPICCAIIGDSWFLLLTKLYNGRSLVLKLFKRIFIINIIINIGCAIFFSSFHQVGIKPATNFVSKESRNIDFPNIWVLMPCYSFPVNTYINNQNARLEYFTCSPPGLEFNSPNIQKVDFLEVNLTAFIQGKLQNKYSFPDFVFVYDYSTQAVMKDLKKISRNFIYKVCFEIYHTMFPFDNIGERVRVLCKQKTHGYLDPFLVNYFTEQMHYL